MSLPAILTSRLRLRPFTEADAAFILRLLNEPAFLANIGDKGVRDLAGAEAYLREGPMASYAKHGHGLLAVELEDGTPVGMCGLLQRDYLPQPDLGYALLPEHCGRGYAVEAGAAVLEAAARPRVLATVLHANVPSIRVLGKLGFRYERDMADHGERVALYAREQI